MSVDRIGLGYSRPMPRFKHLIDDQHILQAEVGNVERRSRCAGIVGLVFKVGMVERSAGSGCSIRVSVRWGY